MKYLLTAVMGILVSAGVSGGVTAETRFVNVSQLESIKESIAKQMCSDGGTWVTCYNFEANLCHDVAASTIVPCLPSAVLKYPDSKKDLAVKEMIACMDKVFDQRWGNRRKKTLECQKPFPHLQ